MFLQRQKRLRIFIAGLHVYIRRRLPLFGSRRAFYCNVVLKIIPLLLLLSWPFLSFSNLSVRVPALSHSAFEPIFLDRFTRLEQNGHGAFGCRLLVSFALILRKRDRVVDSHFVQLFGR